MHTSLHIYRLDLLINKKRLSDSFRHVPHAVYIFALVDSSSKSKVFFCFPLSVRLCKFYCTSVHCHLWLHCWHLLWKEFHSLYFWLWLSRYLAKPTLLDETQ